MIDFGNHDEYVYRINKENLSICNKNPVSTGNPSVLEGKNVQTYKTSKNKREKNRLSAVIGPTAEVAPNKHF